MVFGLKRKKERKKERKKKERKKKERKKERKKEPLISQIITSSVSIICANQSILLPIKMNNQQSGSKE